MGIDLPTQGTGIDGKLELDLAIIQGAAIRRLVHGLKSAPIPIEFIQVDIGSHKTDSRAVEIAGCYLQTCPYPLGLPKYRTVFSD